MNEHEKKILIRLETKALCDWSFEEKDLLLDWAQKMNNVNMIVSSRFNVTNQRFNVDNTINDLDENTKKLIISLKKKLDESEDR